MTLIKLSVSNNLKEFQQQLTQIEKQQLPFATRMALTRCAQQAKSDLRDEMLKRFNKPTPYTLNSLYVSPATKNQPFASVEIKGDAFKGRPPIKWLGPEIDGGARSMKGFELKLSGQSGGMYAVPSNRISDQLDQYGNFSRAKIRLLLSRLSAASGSGYDANIGKRTREKLRKRGVLNYQTRGRRLATSDFFVARSKRTNSPFGVYQFLGNHQVKPWLIFTPNAPSYTQRLPFDHIVLQ
jgi:hypothetical protein